MFSPQVVIMSTLDRSINGPGALLCLLFFCLIELSPIAKHQSSRVSCFAKRPPAPIAAARGRKLIACNVNCRRKPRPTKSRTTAEIGHIPTQYLPTDQQLTVFMAPRLVKCHVSFSDVHPMEKCIATSRDSDNPGLRHVIEQKD